uniref:Uncharacterized protein n=1 Tax=Sphaerodactylus townsendi TaxID=933632 RepID=A0ACB8EQM5_9SAUR
MATAPFSPQRESFYRSTVENTRLSAWITHSPLRRRWAEMGEVLSELRNSCGAGWRAPSHSPGPRAGRHAHSEGPLSRRGVSDRIGHEKMHRMGSRNDRPEGSQGNALQPPSTLPEMALAVATAPGQFAVGAEEAPPQVSWAGAMVGEAAPGTALPTDWSAFSPQQLVSLLQNSIDQAVDRQLQARAFPHSRRQRAVVLLAVSFVTVVRLCTRLVRYWGSITTGT